MLNNKEKHILIALIKTVIESNVPNSRLSDYHSEHFNWYSLINDNVFWNTSRWSVYLYV